MVPVLNVMNLSFLTVSFCFLALSGCGAPPIVSVPAAYDNWNSPDGTFALNYPAGWEAKGNGNRSRGIAWAECKEGLHKVRIDASFADVVIGDIANFGGGAALGLEQPSEELTPEAIVQAKKIAKYEEKFKDYVEQPGSSLNVTLGPTYYNEFSAVDGFTKISGIRSTTMARDRCVTFLAHCPAAQWDEFKPVFLKMLEEMESGAEEL